MKSLEARKRLLIAEANMQRTIFCLEMEAMRLDLQDAAWKALVTGTVTSVVGSLLHGGRSRSNSATNEKAPKRQSLMGGAIRLYEVGRSLWRVLQTLRPGAREAR
ncbi:MAG TPA: hypothetical protein VMF06_16975 [Candidatus Limnocylindria bacterium]|jgi:hypothetical protein|nr:hypothetical protein [Candidatus Limnocylindria bacterium]